MAGIDGHLFRIKKDGANFDCQTSVTADFEREIERIVCADNYPAGELVEGELTATAEVEGLLEDDATNAGMEILDDLITGGVTFAVTIAATTGKSINATECRFRSGNITANVGERVTYSGVVELGGTISISSI